MPAGMKPSPEFCGKKGRSGTKTKAEIISEAKDSIKKEALVDLSKNKVYIQIRQIPDDITGFKNTQLMALPIVLRDMTEKHDIMSGGKPIYLPSEIIQRNEPNNTPSNPETSSTGQAPIQSG